MIISLVFLFQIRDFFRYRFFVSIEPAYEVSKYRQLGKTQNYYEDMITLIINLQVSLEWELSLNEILNLVEIIHSNITNIRGRKILLQIFLKRWKVRNSLNDSFLLISRYILWVLEAIQKNLINKIESEKEKLENTKNSMDLKWGIRSLSHISALQQTHLDKQIEQFEELQRVLVKV